MNIQEYIESGILEQYALGELSEAERADVERLAAEHPQIREELNVITDALGAYAQAHAQAPPAGMRERVLSGWQAAIKHDTGAPESQSAAAPQPQAAPVAESVVRQMPVNQEYTQEAPAARFNWMMAAAVVLLLLSAVGNLLLYTRWKEAESSLAIAQSEQARVASSVQAVQRTLGYRTQELAILRSDQFHSVTLAGMPVAPTARAKVLYNPATRKVYVDVHSLPTPPSGKQYQLWALDNGKPIDAGMLAAATAAGDSLQQMKDVASAQAFAMTVEEAGGSANPTMSTLTVMGKM
ncbi:anti-sigma factor [Hymenobacter jejuensis]|uniref:Regulator of SigK n=1 Tax=Hymenobacter jejuensis TaxID=2502781 RepID=A0A5B8A4Q2_9BACT|nr:anti-sigma factor [Hymenobacter jejuensis]QDA62290.1 anti-sigma factor [Hymenobacter jejuensis]